MKNKENKKRKETKKKPQTDKLKVKSEYQLEKGKSREESVIKKT